MDASSQKPYSYIAIGVCFVIVCAIVGCIIYYITKDNTKTENFLSPTITEPNTPTPTITEPNTPSSLSWCQRMINILIRDMYTHIMGTPCSLNYQCTAESDRDSFLDTLYYILQVPTLQILNNATSIDNLDKTNFINLWSTAITGLNNDSSIVEIDTITEFDPNMPTNRYISAVTIKLIKPPTGNLSMPVLMYKVNISSSNSYPQIPSSKIPDNYKQSLIDISKKASKFVTLQDIADLKADTSSTISADNITKYLLLLLVHKGTFFTR